MRRRRIRGSSLAKDVQVIAKWNSGGDRPTTDSGCGDMDSDVVSGVVAGGTHNLVHRNNNNFINGLTIFTTINVAV